MTIHPEVQAKARAELDAVIGPDRLPSLKDREQLPYMNALIKEVFRCGLVVPQGLPHKARANDIHDGYLIPRGSLIMTNIWYEIQNNASCN
jgi:cytochrome P450